MVTVETNPAGVPRVDCRGGARERGEQHGEALRGRIAAGLARWEAAVAAPRGVSLDRYVEAFLRGTDFLPAIRRWTPDLLDEITGIARGAGQPWERIFAFNLLDEEWTWRRGYRPGAPPGCTVVGFAPRDAAPLLAQTMDIDRYHDGAQALLRIAGGDGPDQLVFTYAGMLGLTGCNDAGVAVVVNNLDTLPASPTGLPVACAIRGILGHRHLTEAVGFVGAVPHATGQHYGLASPDGLASIEGWATGIAAAGAGSARLLHTNHPLYTAETIGDPEASYRSTRTRERLAYLEREAGPRRDAVGVQALLADRTVPVSIDAARPSMTFGAVVYECAAPPRIWLAPGPPHAVPFGAVAWA